MKFLFDLGGVFFDWNPEYFYKDIFLNKKELKYFLNNVCNDEWNIAQDRGRSVSEAVNVLSKKYPNYENEIKMFYNNFKKMFAGIYLESIHILQELKNRKIQCYVLSNWSAESFLGMEKEYTFLKMFDGMISPISTENVVT